MPDGSHLLERARREPEFGSYLRLFSYLLGKCQKKSKERRAVNLALIFSLKLLNI